MKNTIGRKERNCRICNSTNIVDVFELNPTPPGDLFLPKEKLHLSSTCYPLILALCETCGYLHTPYVLDPRLSYEKCLYETSITVGLSKNYKDYAEAVVTFTEAAPSSFVVDLGSNDGTMLKAFKENGMNVLGVEPNKQIASVANQNQLETINDYFSASVADNIIQKYGGATIVSANYAYANIDNVIDFTQNVKKLLNDNGVFVIQTGYHPEQMKINMFDYIYHEHFSYFTVRVLRKLLEDCEMELIHVSLHKAKGGSIRAIVQHRGGERDVDESVESFVRAEEFAAMHEPETYRRFADEIDSRKKELLDLLKKIHSAGHSIVGYGASHSTTTLMHHFELGDFLDFIVDDNPIKHGLYSPGHHLPVYPSKKLYDDKLEYVLVLGWQHQDSIINRNRRFLEKGGKFIVPLPESKIVSGRS